PDSLRLGRRGSAMHFAEQLKDLRVGEVAVAEVEVVMAAHWDLRQVDTGRGFARVADPTPHRWVRELRFDLAGGAEDTDETFVHDDHEHGVVPWSAATVAWRRRDDRGQFVDLSARKN